MIDHIQHSGVTNRSEQHCVQVTDSRQSNRTVHHSHAEAASSAYRMQPTLLGDGHLPSTKPNTLTVASSTRGKLKKAVTSTGTSLAVKMGAVARLFVTRLQPETTVNEVIGHINKKSV